jgi:hypothetical protein
MPTSPAVRKIGRDARTGRFISVAEARRRPATTVIETIRAKRLSALRIQQERRTS